MVADNPGGPHLLAKKPAGARTILDKNGQSEGMTMTEYQFAEIMYQLRWIGWTLLFIAVLSAARS